MGWLANQCDGSQILNPMLDRAAFTICFADYVESKRCSGLFSSSPGLRVLGGLGPVNPAGVFYVLSEVLRIFQS